MRLWHYALVALIALLGCFPRVDLAEASMVVQHMALARKSQQTITVCSYNIRYMAVRVCCEDAFFVTKRIQT
jgi:hypothetical protein